MSDDIQITRLINSNIIMSAEEREAYVQMPDILTDAPAVLPKGYKKCTKCGQVKKMYLYNRNSSSKDNCTTQCKECQKKNAHKSYANNKHKKTYKAYYQKHKAEKQEQSRKYYQEHKEELKVKHAQYLQTKAGQKAMNKAHRKRNKNLKANAGIPYTRDWVIERDKRGGTEPICYLCGKPITGTQQIHLDHVIPVVMGGMDCFTNIACVHDTCNLMKSKDAREITEEQVTGVIKLSEQYIDEHPDLFPDIFGDVEAEDND